MKETPFEDARRETLYQIHNGLGYMQDFCEIVDCDCGKCPIRRGCDHHETIEERFKRSYAYQYLYRKSVRDRIKRFDEEYNKKRGGNQ